MAYKPFDWVAEAILSRLTRRFYLTEEPENNPLALLHTIQPITQVDDLLVAPAIADSGAMDLTGAGTVIAYTVPAGKKAKLIFYRKSSTTGTRNIQVFDGTTPCAICAAGSTENVIQLSPPLPLPEGWVIRSQATSDGADGAITDYFLFLLEDAYGPG